MGVSTLWVLPPGCARRGPAVCRSFCAKNAIALFASPRAGAHRDRPTLCVSGKAAGCTTNLFTQAELAPQRADGEGLRAVRAHAHCNGMRCCISIGASNAAIVVVVGGGA